MSLLAKSIVSLEPKAQFLIEGGKIRWVSNNVSQPTDEEIQAEIERLKVLEAKEKQRLELKATREQSLSELTYTFADGSIIQVRPSDIPTFQLAIAQGESQDWVMADDTVKTITVDDMQEAMNSGIAQAKVVWQEYTTALKAFKN